MDASLFIGKRLRFKGKIVISSVAVSFFVIIIAVAVSSGFRHEIRTGLSVVTGDVQLTHPNMNILEEDNPVNSSPSYMPVIEDLAEVERVVPAVYRAAIVKSGEDIHGILVKGIPEGASVVSEVPESDTVALAVSIPQSFAEISGIGPGDKMLTYFIGSRLKVRQFNVVSTYQSSVDVDGRYLIYADIDDMRRLNGWGDDQASMMEIVLKPESRTERGMEEAAAEIGFIANSYATEDDDVLVASSAVAKYPQVFDWLSLIDFNVFFILLLMIIVAGFNMISGLLIMLFENISTIGLLKSVGMTDKAIAKVFLSSASVLVLKGMAAGNLLAFLFCLIQSTTHVLKLNPENYFLSFVPVHLDMGMILLADAAAFAGIMILLLIPSMFISRVDPAETVRVK